MGDENVLGSGMTTSRSESSTNKPLTFWVLKGWSLACIIDNSSRVWWPCTLSWFITSSSTNVVSDWSSRSAQSRTLWPQFSLWWIHTGTIKELVWLSPWPLARTVAESPWLGWSVLILESIVLLAHSSCLLKSPWKGVGCSLQHTSQVFLWVQSLDKCPGSKQAKHNLFSFSRCHFFLKEWFPLQNRHVLTVCLFCLRTPSHWILFTLALWRPPGLYNRRRPSNLVLPRQTSSLLLLLPSSLKGWAETTGSQAMSASLDRNLTNSEKGGNAPLSAFHW